MRRFLFVLALLAIPAVVVAAPSVYDQVWGDRVDERLCGLEADVGIVSVECVPETTTTTSSTTTTQATTTTTAPTKTTTTQPSGLVIPPTQPYSFSQYKEAGGYDIMAWNVDTGQFWWSAPYLGSTLPYTDGATWIDGDREGYRCAYGFITDATGWDIQGRFAFVRAPDQSYGGVNDRYMDEGTRYLDGTFIPGGREEIPDENCTDVLSDIDYEGACREVDERPRVAFFDSQGNVLDIRDYTNTDASEVWFNLHNFDGTRATVIACTDEGVGMIVYYQAMGSGQIAVDFNGTGPFG